MCDSHPKHFVTEEREFNWNLQILNDKKKMSIIISV